MRFRLYADFTVPDYIVEQKGKDIIIDEIWDNFVCKGNDKYYDEGDVIELEK